MPQVHANPDDIKRKLRELKKLEVKLRFENVNPQTWKIATKSSRNTQNTDFVWDTFFDLKAESTKDVRYPFGKLLLMTKEEFKDAINEYFYHVYYWYYKENGVTDDVLINPDLLAQFGLSINADINEIKVKFRELAKQYHPDNGGDGTKFIELLEQYNRLRNSGSLKQ